MDEIRVKNSGLVPRSSIEEGGRGSLIIVGELILHLDDGSSQQTLRLSGKTDGVRLGPMLWHSMSDFTPDCVALLVASLPYDESDYIRDYEEFKKYTRALNLR